MSRTKTHGKTMFAFVVYVLTLHLSFSASGDDYRFTFSNPEVGESDAPYVLEYFSLVDCGPCREFETTQLGLLKGEIDSGQLRVVFRDLVPVESMTPAATRLFCIQEHPSLLEKRIETKRTGIHQYDSYVPLHGKQRARLAQCLEAIEPINVMTFNTRVFEDYGFRGTPSFVLYAQNELVGVRAQWSGTTSASTVKEFLRKLDQKKSVDAAAPIFSARPAVKKKLHHRGSRYERVTHQLQ